MSSDASSLAVYIDLENVAIGVRDAKLDTFDIKLVLQRLLQKGNVVVKKAYADWKRYESYKRPLHEVGVELIDIPGSKLTGKNSADIKMVVDALELSFTKPHIDTFALVSGDSDFSPLVSKLRENDRKTIGIGVKNSTSPMLVEACDDFVFYDDLAKRTKRRKKATRLGRLPAATREAFELLLEAAHALQRDGRTLHGSLVKETMKRMQPAFDEESAGYASFGKLLQDAAERKLITLGKGERSGTWLITELQGE